MIVYIDTHKMEPPIFSIKDDFKSYLDEHGYVVIGDIMKENNLIDKFWSAWTQCSLKFKRDDMSTWTIENTPMMFAKGMAVFSGLAHSDFMWDVRLNKNIRKIFAKVHGTKDLISSFDGFSVFFTHKQKTKPWLHVDQNPSNPLYCVQGQYNFLPVREDSSGFIVVPGSHRTNVDSSTNRDWVLVGEHPDAVKLIIPENCFTLWNSRMLHANTGMTSKQVRLDRLTCYVTYLPRSYRTSESVFEHKVKAYENGDGTSHWANRCEIKKYPWGFGPRYESHGFHRIKPGELTDERLLII